MRKAKYDELMSYIEEMKTVALLDKCSIQIVDGILEKSFLSIDKMTCLLGNGQLIQREQLLKGQKEGSAGIVLPITDSGQTLLVVQPRPLTKSTVGIEFPAGYIEEGEEPMVAARRELMEETGYVPGEMYLLAKYYQDQGCSKAFNHSFLAIGCRKEREQQLDASEFIRYFECSYEEALELADLGYIHDANSLLALEKSKGFVRERVKRFY